MAIDAKDVSFPLPEVGRMTLPMSAQWELPDGSRCPVDDFPEVVVGERVSMTMPTGPCPRRLLLLIWDQPFKWLDVDPLAKPGDAVSFGPVTLS